MISLIDFQVRLSVAGSCTSVFPQILDPIGLAGLPDVIVNGAHFRTGVFVFNQAARGQGRTPLE
jgi:hypothetical protein